jgi:phage terminase large subunit-like protein
MTRLAENSGLKPRAYYDCNPPSRKHWTYIVFVEHKDPVTGEKLPEHLHTALQINPEDNKRNQAEGYIDTILAALPKRQRQRFLAGVFTLDIVGALWDQMTIDKARAKDAQWKKYRTVVGIDPATTNNPDSDEHGIIVASAYTDETFRVDADYTTRGSPQMWAMAAMYAYEHHDADAIIIETNQGGDMCESTLRNAGFKGRIIRVHASKGKFARAEPISALYEQGRVSHADRLDALEAQMMEWVPHLSKESPDRIDALVWVLTELSNAFITPTAGVFGR